MRIAFIGIGALGGYFGGRLAKAGNDVIFIARGAMLEALRKDGLRVESPLGDFALPKVQATGDPTAVGHVDAVFVTTKAWQMTEAAQQIRSMIGPETIVVPLQNGVEAYDQLAAVLGSEHVLEGMCHILAMVTAPGVVRHAGAKALITIGERNNVRTPRLEKLVECLSSAEIDTRVPDNIQVALWEKFEFVASFGAVGAITRAPAGVIRSLPETRSLLENAAREIVGLARATGIPVPSESVVGTMKLVDSAPPNGSSSMQRDLVAGRPSELEAQSGSVVRLGRACNFPTPVHEIIYNSLLPGELRARGKLTF
ncbi:2-dehydropantoate 2-reductase [Acidicapsa acidisoli]|uniref:2-dehydropantoate 2-reductase n=1 Tax=Acidicapsa acidisoli TaxID=1615681 RepID=UPI0021DF6E6C|nr:2-dehydropantoate 2-reductase [Acidicapsa acidisoli]